MASSSVPNTSESETPKPKMKCVVRFTVKDRKSGTKAFRIAAETPGMQSVALIGDLQDQLEMVGSGIDWPAELKRRLEKKKLGPAEQLLLVSYDSIVCAIL